jgi:hypothetical protein
MLMKLLLAEKQTPEQVKSNDAAANLFVMAIMNMDLQMLSSLLDPKRRYLGGRNHWQTSHFFKSLFDKAIGKNTNIGFHRGHSLDYYPGALYFEFRFSFFDEAIDMDELNYDTSELKPEDCAFICRFVLAYKDGKIIDIREPKEVLENNKLQKEPGMN